MIVTIRFFHDTATTEIYTNLNPLSLHDALPLLSQSGYLTIKGYDREIRAYELAIPNEEVHAAYVRDLLSPDADKHTVDEWEIDAMQP